MNIRCDNQYITGTDGRTILGQPMLFECMFECVLSPALFECVLSPAHESEMRGYLVNVLIVKYLSHRFYLNSATIH